MQKRGVATSQNSPHALSDVHVLQSLASIIKQEATTLLNAALLLPHESVQLLKEILATTGRLVFSGVGKSGLVARKLVATFSSVGIPSFFLHPNDALHGDIGMVCKEDFLILLSKSGTGSDLEKILLALKASKNKTALICCNKGIISTLVDITVELPFTQEACMFGLAPTSSTTLMMAFGDALAITVSKINGFKKQDFVHVHPAGALGKNLSLPVAAFTCGEEALPLLQSTTTFKDLLVIMTKKKLGVGIVVNEKQELLGIITDGNLRRACDMMGPGLFNKEASNIMTPNPKTISQHILAYKALEIMETYNITSLVVTEEKKVIGLVHIHDLIKAGIGRQKEV